MSKMRRCHGVGRNNDANGLTIPEYHLIAQYWYLIRSVMASTILRKDSSQGPITCADVGQGKGCLLPHVKAAVLEQLHQHRDATCRLHRVGAGRAQRACQAAERPGRLLLQAAVRALSRSRQRGRRGTYALSDAPLRGRGAGRVARETVSP